MNVDIAISSVRLHLIAVWHSKLRHQLLLHLRTFARLAHAAPQSVNFINLMAASIAYTDQEKKPSLKLYFRLDC
jgi:hypothetical protein